MRNPPLDATKLREALVGVADGADIRVDVVERTGSTNADLGAAAQAGAPDRAVLIAEAQDAGRGRLDRKWVSPPGAGLTFSVLFRLAGVPSVRWGWLSLLAGVSLVRTIRELTSVPAWLKWPNDVLLGAAQAKGAGLLAEVAVPDEAAPAVVLGIGLNVHTRLDELPPGATSLSAEGADVRRDELLIALLRGLLTDEAAWRAAGGDPEAVGLRADYQGMCATLGERVRVELPDGGVTEGTAVGIDARGRLLVRADSAGFTENGGDTYAVAVGDVVHVRSIR